MVANRKEDADAIFVDVDTRIQVLESMPFLSRADKEQCAAFIVSDFLYVHRDLG